VNFRKIALSSLAKSRYCELMALVELGADSFDVVAAAIDAAPYDDRPESDEERAAIAEARTEPDGFVPRDVVAHMIVAWSPLKSA